MFKSVLSMWVISVLLLLDELFSISCILFCIHTLLLYKSTFPTLLANNPINNWLIALPLVWCKHSPGFGKY